MPEEEILSLPEGSARSLIKKGEMIVLPPSREYSSDALVKSESEAWHTFLGEPVEVPPVPKALFETQQRAQEQDRKSTRLNSSH